jgi:hypothetical protein
VSYEAIQRRKAQIRACGWLSLALLLLAGPFNRAGLWEPVELRFAELSRRLAHQLFNANVLFAADETLKSVTQGQLPTGELPWTSSALGFALLGPNDFAGRFASLGWGLLSAVTLWVLLGKLASRNAQVWSLLTLVSLPSFVWQSRMMLGDAATMGSLSLATTGLMLGCFDVGPRWAKAGWALLGAMGLVAGLYCRGLLLGVAVPATAVGIAGLRFFIRTTNGRIARANAIAFPAVCFGVGLVAASFGCVALLRAASGHSSLLGAALQGPYSGGSFAVVIAALFHAAFPWSAFFPVAVAEAAVAPRQRDEASLRIQALSTSLLLVVLLTVAAMGAMSFRLVTMPFAAVAALAGLSGLVIARGQSEDRSIRLPAVSVATIALVAYADFENLPEKLLLATGVSAVKLPDGVLLENRVWIRLALAVLLLSCLVVVVGKYRPGLRPFSRQRVTAFVHQAQVLFAGHFMSGLVLLETMLITTALMVHAHEREFIFVPLFASTLPNLGLVLKLLWLLPPVVVVALPLGFSLVTEGSSFLLSVGRGHRSIGNVPVQSGVMNGKARVITWYRVTPMTLLAGGLLLSGLCVTLGQIPRLSEQLSAKSALRRYEQLAKPGEPLALLGMNAKSARYYLPNTPKTFSEIGAAAHWLDEGQSTRRFLAFGRQELAELNAAYRAETSGRNLVVCTPSDGYLLLGRNETGDSAFNYNPLVAALPAVPPTLRHSLSGAFGDAIEPLGWEFRDSRDRVVDVLEVGQKYSLRLSLRVIDTLHADWQLFVHVDGRGRRQNGDHEPVNGDYPTDLWQPGDIVLDEYLLKLEPEMGPGPYRLYFGFFRNTRRLDVTRGNHDDNRMIAGDVTIR